MLFLAKTVKFILLYLIIVFLITLLIGLVSEARGATAGNSDSSLVARASKGKVTADRLGLRALLIAYKSPGDSVEPGMVVFVTTCPTGQQLPFEFILGRKLDASSEKFSKSRDGKTLIWNIRDVPNRSAVRSRLPVQFQVPLNKGGPIYCAQVWGTTLSGEMVSPPTTLVWDLK